MAEQEWAKGRGQVEMAEQERAERRGQVEMTILVVPGRAKDLMPPPLSFRSEARNLLCVRMPFSHPHGIDGVVKPAFFSLLPERIS